MWRIRGAIEQDVDNSMQMLVVSVVLTGYHSASTSSRSGKTYGPISSSSLLWWLFYCKKITAWLES